MPSFRFCSVVATLASIAMMSPARAALVGIAPSAFSPNAQTITFGTASNDGTVDPVYIVSSTLVVSFGSHFVGQSLTSSPADGGLYYLTGTAPSGPLALMSDPDDYALITTDASTGNDTNERLAGAAPGSFLGPVAILFSAPVQQVAFTAGVFSEAGDLLIQGFKTDGTSLGLVSNTGADQQQFYFADSNGAGIGGLVLYIPDQSLNGFSIDNVSFTDAGTPAPMPEPATLPLLAGLLACAALPKIVSASFLLVRI